MTKHRHDRAHRLGKRKRRFPMGLVGLVLGTVLTAAIFIVAPRFSGLPKSTPPRSTDAPAATTPASDPKAKANPQRLIGRWLRPDGGYILDIQGVKGDRSLEVAYLNPNPIHVSRAETEEDGKTLRVFVELRDVNYPGCTYKLTYDPDKDQLTGIYFQAALNETFDVAFARMK
ncbi:MAG: hypothetical protein KA191_09755 [Verrucomicrobia bacterium]|jgi:hypothetical protein|nr:hypothetical protein [Verrucomicrobiota bacterium]OQC63685.1 MAG: hypothetical protein BWX48_03088 [Verrucomicrobia bacterium ADurb.Bin006]MDI9379469.1 hypothetical protein [Verrucomicrobiota bacterium]NMD19181.1 hypothetical protein [Verrucomicrobiota bacterium]HNV00281.1 hypothetical protein [Verrucomicrobiota bacterium]